MLLARAQVAADGGLPLHSPCRPVSVDADHGGGRWQACFPSGKRSGVEALTQTQGTPNVIVRTLGAQTREFLDLPYLECQRTKSRWRRRNAIYVEAPAKQEPH